VFLAEYLTPQSVLLAPDISGRDELFGLFASLFVTAGLVRTASHLTKRLVARESVLTTGIGNGMAVPHAQISGLGRLAMAASVHPEGITYPSLDDRPVRLVFCLIGDTNTSAEHLAGLARLARLARKQDQLEQLIQAETALGFIRTLRRIEGS
jgi:mannitol/fructose-specific phosphotransferase system IIA component (Ntr-type)